MTKGKRRFELECRLKDLRRNKQKRLMVGPYDCPTCEENTLHVKITPQLVTIHCTSCGFYVETANKGKIFEPLDYYHDICDLVL